VTTSEALPIAKARLREFEALLDEEFARRPANGFAANETLILACNMVETAAAQKPFGPVESMLNDGIETFAPHLVSGRPGTEPDAQQLLDDLMFGFHYHHIRELLYYSYNAPGAVDWDIGEGEVEIRFHDRSLPRQFFTTWNEWYFTSDKTFRDFTEPDEIGRLLKGAPELSSARYIRQSIRFCGSVSRYGYQQDHHHRYAHNCERGVSERTIVFAGVTAYRCGETTTSISAGTDRHWTGFAPSPS
jgi:hypothetical protein